ARSSQRDSMSSVSTSAVVVAVAVMFVSPLDGRQRLSTIVRSWRFGGCVRVLSCLRHLLAQAGEAVALAEFGRFGQRQSRAVPVGAAAVLGVVVKAVGQPERGGKAAAEGGGALEPLLCLLDPAGGRRQHSEQPVGRPQAVARAPDHEELALCR